MSRLSVRYESNGSITKLIITKRDGTEETALIDTEDLAIVRDTRISWCMNYNKKYNYKRVIGRYQQDKRSKHVYLSRFIINAQKDTVVDHINHDPMDNRKENLRVVTVSANGQNRKGAQVNNKIGLRGVQYHKASGKYVASLEVDGAKYYIGIFTTEKEADAAIKKARADLMPYSSNEAA